MGLLEARCVHVWMNGEKMDKIFADSAELKSFLKTIPFCGITKRTNPDLLKDFIVIDTETTGLDAVRDEIIDVGAIRFRDWQPAETFSMLLKPHRHIPSSVSDINHITDDMVASSPYYADVVPELQTFIGNDNLVGQNLSFDLGFLVNWGLPLNMRNHIFFDTMLVAEKLLRTRYSGYYDRVQRKWVRTENDNYDIENLKLETLCRYYDVPLENAHRAANDALATGLLFRKLTEAATEA